MSLNPVAFKQTNTPVDYKLQELLKNKFQSLSRYVGEASDLRCDVEFEKVAPHQHGPVYRIEVNLFAYGNLHRAEATEESFEAAIDVVRAELEAELEKARGKRQTLWRRGARRMKEMMRFSR
jgi:ribosomal subunit interface protein